VIVHFEYDNFEPSHITIHAGQTVQWQWSTPQLPGNVTFEGFASPTQQTGAWAHTFSSPGTYAYRDTLRQVATGSVTVVP
jgi:plastocyanin